MEQNVNNTPIDPYFNDTQSKPKFSIDPVLWFYRILKYWYLFIISAALFTGYAYLKNKSWIPYYVSGAVMMMEPRGQGAIGGGVNLGTLVQNSVNQRMILTSHDMTVRAVTKIPQQKIEYTRRTKFKTENIYGMTPLRIVAAYASPKAYPLLFQIEPIDANKCRIFYDGTETTPAFSMEIPYGQFITESRFSIKIEKTDRFYPNFEKFYFRFVSQEELVGRYVGRVAVGFRAEGSSALNVNIQGENPTQDIEYLNALLKEFQAYNLELKNEAAERTVAFIDRQLRIIEDSLRTSEGAFREFQQKEGMYGIENIDRHQKLDQNAEKLGQMKADKDMLMALSEGINSSILENKELIVPINLGINTGNLSTLVDQYNRMVKVFNNMGKAMPLYDKTEQSLNDVRIKILESLRTLQNVAQESEEKVYDEINKLEIDKTTMPDKEREYRRFEYRYSVNDKYSAYLQQRRYEAKLQQAANIPDNFVLEHPRQQTGATNGGETRDRYMFFFLVGLVLPLGFVFCKEELFNYSISTKEDCERLSGLPVVGTIENVSKKLSTGTILVKNFPKSSFAESFRNMRIRIEYMAQKESDISILVTSAEPGDGKTFIAGNIASVYQLTGKKVILVDFDLRRPSVGKLLNIQSKKGVSNFLIGQVSLDEIIVTHPEYEFDVITAGTLPPNPSELIKTKKTKDLIDYLQTKYDYVVIDCSPIGLVSDAYILSKLVDTTMFVVRRAKTNKAFFKSVVGQMYNDGLDHVALIFNDVKGREGYYGTSRYYGDKSYYLKRNSYYHDDYFEK